ncbi:HpcH/HpaI aldolase family protein [Spiribacter onubensis]|uniref:Aldolase/citrate lyase family protein n=1 Tax=Spiribacter onubensis TaxID=3122420 RepID=A0ABV3S8V2_9GAMM
MRKNGLRALWEAERPALNGWCSIGNPLTAEIMAAQGFDSVTVDIQHGALDYTALLPMFQAMKASGATLMARVPWRDPSWIMKTLDAGAEGIICPMINSRAEAEEFVSYLRYPPLGQRSFGPTRAAFGLPGYNVPDANSQILALAMIETADGVENLEAIASTPGLDGIYVGPADLTLGTQDGRLAPGFDRQEPEMIELIQHIASVCNAHGIAACLHCGSADYAARAISWGYRLTTVGGDSRFLAAAAGTAVANWREQTGRDQATSTEGAY